MIEITPTEVKVSYSIGVKCNMGQKTFESADAHFSETWTFSPDAVTPEGIEEQADKLFGDLKVKLDKRAEDFYSEHSTFAK